MATEAEELDGIRYWDERAINIEGGGDLGFLFLNMTTFDLPDELRKPCWENPIWMTSMVIVVFCGFAVGF